MNIRPVSSITSCSSFIELDEQKQKKELIDCLCSNSKEISQNNCNNLNLDGMHKMNIHAILAKHSKEDLQLLSEATSIFFNRLQLTNENRLTVIQMLLKLPSSEWQELQKLISHFLGFNLCANSLIKGLDVITAINNPEARQNFIENAFKNVSFDTPLLERVNILSTTIFNYLNTVEFIYAAERADEPCSSLDLYKVTKITEREKIKKIVLSGDRFVLPGKFDVRREVICTKKHSVFRSL